jgi:cytochrome c oxidase accessory protein FixG
MSKPKIGQAIDVVNVEPEIQVYDLYAKREKIYTRAMKGVYQRIRLFTGWPLLLGYFLLPWLNVDGRQAVFFDLPARKFHVFWLTFWPQDFTLLGWALMIAAFALFFVTTWAGRLWCGYSCPQTVWTAIFMWVEQLTEGTRNQRIKLDNSPMTKRKFLRKTAKHTLWLGFALLTGATFIGYFYGIRDMAVDIVGWQVNITALSWIVFFSLATYINAGYMREQVCIHMCPYARFQSAMFDRNTLIVSYDEKRGENRGKRRKSQDPAELGLGDCIDCKLCVQVCPTGIDIRNGLQYECIDCALCIDACDDVMEKMGYEKGLISYTTHAKQAGEKTSWMRPKLLGYGAVCVFISLAFVATLYSRVTLQLDVLRDRGALFQQRADGLIQNNYTLKIINMAEAKRTMTLSVGGIDGLSLETNHSIEAGPGEVISLPVAVTIAPDKLTQMANKIEFMVTSSGEHAHQAERESRFFGPGGK